MNNQNDSKHASWTAAAGLGRRHFLGGAGLVAGSLIGRATAAPLESDQALIAAAKREGKLVLYTGSEESIVANLGRAFQGKFGVSLEYERLNSGEIGARYTAEARAGKTVADLIISGDRALADTFVSNGWVKKLDSTVLPGFDEWPAEYKDDYSVVVTINPYTIAINTQLIREVPQDWTDLLKPSFKGEIIALDLKRVNLVVYAVWDWALKQFGEDFLRKLGQQQLRLFDSGPSSVQQLASGAGAVYVPCSTTEVVSMSNQGAPVKGILPAGKPYTGVVSPATISEKAPHPNAARLFLAYLLTAEGQKILNVVASSPNNTPGTPPLPDGFVKPDFKSAAANRNKLIELLGM